MSQNNILRVMGLVLQIRDLAENPTIANQDLDEAISQRDTLLIEISPTDITASPILISEEKESFLKLQRQLLNGADQTRTENQT